eukprot:4458218-Pyramimonas_sp.AAC.1
MVSVSGPSLLAWSPSSPPLVRADSLLQFWAVVVGIWEASESVPFGALSDCESSPRGRNERTNPSAAPKGKLLREILS